MNDTFLTEALVVGFPEPEAMTRVREEHSRLQGVVFSLNQKISQVLAKQEGDFLAAYRAHMYTVQKELQTLRQRVIEAESVLQVTNQSCDAVQNEQDVHSYLPFRSGFGARASRTAKSHRAMK